MGSVVLRGMPSGQGGVGGVYDRWTPAEKLGQRDASVEIPGTEGRPLGLG